MSKTVPAETNHLRGDRESPGDGKNKIRVNYSDIPASLKPDVYSTTMVINPVNTRSYYQAGDQIIVDYNSGVRGFIYIILILRQYIYLIKSD